MSSFQNNKVNYEDLVEGTQYLISYNTINGLIMGIGVYKGKYNNMEKLKLKFSDYSKIFIDENNNIVRYFGISTKNNNESSYTLKGNLYTESIFYNLETNDNNLQFYLI